MPAATATHTLAAPLPRTVVVVFSIQQSKADAQGPSPLPGLPRVKTPQRTSRTTPQHAAALGTCLPSSRNASVE